MKTSEMRQWLRDGTLGLLWLLAVIGILVVYDAHVTARLARHERALERRVDDLVSLRQDALAEAVINELGAFEGRWSNGLAEGDE